jgi:GR25 family glycosyltransferase involved in LPS biosynthesis
MNTPFYQEGDIQIKDLEIAIISLKESEDRRRLINFTPNSWVNGYNGKKLDLNYLQNQCIRYTDHLFYAAYGANLDTDIWKCRIGCFLSHMKALSQFSKPLLILEDDFHTTGPIEQRVLKDVPKDWDLLFLGGFHQIKPNKEFNPVLGWNKIDTNLIKYWCTHAYVVRRPKELLKMIRTNNMKPTTLDSYYNKHIFKKLNVYFHYNSLVSQNINFESLIDPSTKYLDKKS